MKTHRHNLLVRQLLVAGLAGVAVTAAAVMPGCRGDRSSKKPRQFLPDMDDSPRLKPQSETEFFADSRSMRPAVPNTIPFGSMAVVSNADWAKPFMADRDSMMADNTGHYQGMDASGGYVARMPIEVTADVLKRGEERFNIYCAVCHGYEGDGQGMVGKRWAVPVANFHDDKFAVPGHADNKSSDGYLFHIAREGLWTEQDGKRTAQRMPGYKHALSAEDTWAVVAHIRVLQQHRRGTLQDVPADQRPGLEADRLTQAAKLAAPAGSTPPATTPTPATTPPPAPTTPAPGTGGSR